VVKTALNLNSFDLQQFPSKRTTRKVLKALQSNAFKTFLGLGLSAKRCKRCDGSELCHSFLSLPAFTLVLDSDCAHGDQATLALAVQFSLASA
jgi:hypothetical protein